MPEKDQIKSIQDLISKITDKIKTVCHDIDTKYIPYLDQLVNSKSMILMHREQFKKIDGAYQKIKKQLKSFRLTVINDCITLMQIATEIDLIRRRFDDLQKEYNRLKENLASQPKDQNEQVNESFRNGQYLSILIQMHAKAQKVINSHNERVIEYNSYINNFNQFINELNHGYIIYTSPVTDKSYSILLTDIVKEISALISPSDDDTLDSKRNKVLSMFQQKYNEELNHLISDSKLDKITDLNEILVTKKENV